jgi:hypothetical protein
LALCIVDVVDARGEAGERDGVGSGGGGGEQREAEREVAEWDVHREIGVSCAPRRGDVYVRV